MYVRQFGGFAMSHDDYVSEYEMLVDDLKKDEASFTESGEYIFVSYNSPFEMENRRNEVWIKVKEWYSDSLKTIIIVLTLNVSKQKTVLH